MKKILPMILCILLLIPLTIQAHSGRTDASGGHYDHQTGEYHYHHGYPAHQHLSGICPYNYDDKTGQNSIGESNSSTFSNSPLSSEIIPYSTNSPSEPTEEPHITAVFIMIALLMPGFLEVIFIILYICVGPITKKFHVRKKVYIQPEISIKKKYIIPLIKVRKIYQKPTIEVKSAPKRWSHVAITESKYPYDKTSTYFYGHDFNGFVTPSGTHCYHKFNCSHIVSKYKVENIYSLLERNYTPCSRCKPPSTVDPWYLELFPEKKQLYKYVRHDIK